MITPQPTTIKTGDLVVINLPGSKRHGKRGNVINFKTEYFQGQELKLASVRILGERQYLEAQLSWLSRP